MTNRQLVMALLADMRDLDETAIIRVVFRDAENVMTHTRLVDVARVGVSGAIVIENNAIKVGNVET